MEESQQVEQKDNLLYRIGKFVFWSIVVVGGLWLFVTIVDGYNTNKEKELDKKLESVCGVITSQQPKNISLHDDCMNRGYEEFSPPSGSGE